jgi:hypothetical protein
MLLLLLPAAALLECRPAHDPCLHHQHSGGQLQCGTPARVAYGMDKALQGIHSGAACSHAGRTGNIWAERVHSRWGAPLPTVLLCAVWKRCHVQV